MNTSIVLLTVAGEESMSTIPGVIMLGLGMVFVGLICIIFLCKLMGFIFGALGAKKEDKPAQTVSSAPAPAAAGTSATVTENRGEILAAVSAAIAEELGADVSALRIISFKKL